MRRTGWIRTTRPPPCRPRTKATPRTTAMPRVLAAPALRCRSPTTVQQSLEDEVARTKTGACAEAPALLRLTLALPYARGYPLSLAEGTGVLDGPARIDGAGAARRAPPRRVRGRRPRIDRAALPAGCATLGQNTLGELGVWVLLAGPRRVPRCRPRRATAGTATATWPRAVRRQLAFAGGRSGTRRRRGRVRAMPTRIAPAVQARRARVAAERAPGGARVARGERSARSLVPLRRNARPPRARRHARRAARALRPNFTVALAIRSAREGVGVSRQYSTCATTRAWVLLRLLRSAHDHRRTFPPRTLRVAGAGS
jgi:hypothetical protein